MELTKQVFLSHTRKDQDLADAIAKILSERGIRVWDEPEVLPGANFARVLTDALEQSDSMIALLTPHSFSSSSVRNQLEHAFFDDRYKHRLLPVLIGKEKEDFVRLPWILTRLGVVRLKDREPTRARARRIADAFIDLLKRSRT